MNAWPIVQPTASAERPASETGRDSLLAKLTIWPYFGILTAFWIYVAFSNVLYANSMQAMLASLRAGYVFAPWEARLLQHVMLYPFLLMSVWASLHVGWQPVWRAAPVQLACALAFSVLAAPALMLAEIMLGHMPWHQWPAHAMNPGLAGFVSGPAIPLWLASATSFFLTYGFGLALVAGFEFYRRLRDAQLRSAALERSLNAAHLAALRMQLSPHTLFNLLHTIHGQIDWNPVVAQSMVVQLADLLRRLLKAGERELSRLCDELQFVRLYLDLQQKRFSDRLTVRVPANDTVPAAWVPSLILQPLVENAVVHGLAGHDAAVVIRVEALVHEETLFLRVINSMSRQQPTEHVGIGLKNVRERLAIQFGERATFHASKGDDDSWIAEIRMPLLRDGP
jgi:two-component system, LytTR family, sensor kinase